MSISLSSHSAAKQTILDQPKAGTLTVKYTPDAEEVYENPPRFVWLPTLDEGSRYVLRVTESGSPGGKPLFT